MPPPVSFFDVEPLFERLRQGELILTSNQRLASRIRNAYVVACRQRGLSAVLTPAVYALGNWINLQWQQLLANAYAPALPWRVLEQNQELTLWEQIIAESESGQALLRPAATAQQAAAAYRLLADWQLPLDTASLRAHFNDSDDTRAWLDWADTFERYCHQHQLLSPAQLPGRLIVALEQSALPVQETITLVGFQDIVPAQQCLVEKASGKLRHYRPERSPGQVTLVQCESAHGELQAAAAWARQVLKHDPAARVAIVAPELSQQRFRVERIVMEAIEPGYNIGTIDSANTEFVSARRTAPFNVSAGYPLLDAPVVSSALDCLSLAQPVLELGTIERLCYSPFNLLTLDDADRMARLIRECRACNSVSLTAARLRQIVGRIAEQTDTGDNPWPFAGALQQVATLCRPSSLGQSRSHVQWGEIFAQLLTAMGWPGGRRLDSIEYQQVTQWQSALQTFGGLATVSGPVGFNTALGQWRAVLSRQVFQAQTAESPLQVLGILEASGLQFTHLWLTSMSAQQWPPSPSPNAFLPLSLQRERGMPHASAEREYQYAKTLTEQFIQSADHVVVSAPETLDDNPAAVSALFSHYEPRTLQQVLGRPLQALLPGLEIRRRYFESQSLEDIDAGDAPPVSGDESIRGGVSIFTDQSACPFRAFASHRLRARELGQVEPGLNAAERGTLLHRSLELLWNTIRSRQALDALSDETLQQHCAQASQYAVEQLLARSAKSLGARFKQIEAARLEKLLRAWLEIEKTRGDFTVLATEQRSRVNFARLDLETSIDRIDQLPDGSLLVIDYKTGKCSPAEWWGERPEQPQLPLYATLAERDSGVTVGAVAFAQLNVETCQFKGAGDSDNPETPLRWNDKTQTDSGQQSWQQQKQYWQKVLTALADDFVSGKAAVDPKYDPQQSPKTCQYCPLKPLCRISHQELAQ